MRAVKSKMCAQSIKKKPKALEKKTIVRFRRHIQRAAKKMKTQPESLFFFAQRGAKCQRMVRRETATHLSYKNCTSIQAYKPRYCGSCTDGRCCTPHRTKTALVDFQCANGKTTRRPVMVILTCACHSHCPRDNAVWPSSELGYRHMRL